MKERVEKICKLLTELPTATDLEYIIDSSIQIAELIKELREENQALKKHLNLMLDVGVQSTNCKNPSYILQIRKDAKAFIKEDK